MVLAPRVIPATDDAEVRALAQAVQARLVAIAEAAGPAKGVDVRPMPERACPQGGCKAPSLGAVVAHDGGGCVVTALVSAAGVSGVTQFPWAGEVSLDKSRAIAFRDTPETRITVRDFVPCGEAAAALPAGEASIAAALKALL